MELVEASSRYDGLPDSVFEALADPDAPLHNGCERFRAAAAELLNRARQSGRVRSDLPIDPCSSRDSPPREPAVPRAHIDRTTWLLGGTASTDHLEENEPVTDCGRRGRRSSRHEPRRRIG
ncbi:hypothetical protein AB0M34_10580 [Nocardia sp. NPDC050193]